MEQKRIQRRQTDAQAGICVASDEFSSLVQNHRVRIFRYLLKLLSDADLAETLTQECFLKAHRGWSRFRGESSTMAWLMRIAINLAKDHWRNRRTRFWRQMCTNTVEMRPATGWPAT
jgi:RNA polymerase sigma-70 factor (ECF subfamily)